MLCLTACTDVSLSAGLSYADNRIFPHGYVDFDGAGPLAMSHYPFASSGRKIVFETSYRSLYDMKELTDNRAAIAFGSGKVTCGAGMASFGEPGYFHQLGLAGFGSFKRKNLAAGGAIVYSRISFSEKYGYLSSVIINLGLAYSRNRITLFAVSRSLNQPRYYAGGRPVLPEAEIGVSYTSREGLDSQAKALFVRYQKPTAELSQSFRLSGHARISWAMVLQPARFAAGLHLEKSHLGFVYRISHHPVLGLTHTVTLSIFKGRTAGDKTAQGGADAESKSSKAE